MPETAKLKSLDRAAGRLVVVAPAFRKLEGIAEDSADAGCVVPGNGQTATSLGAVQGECPDDHMTAWTNGLPDAVGIGELVGRVGQKVKRRAIMSRHKRIAAAMPLRRRRHKISMRDGPGYVPRVSGATRRFVGDGEKVHCFSAAQQMTRMARSRHSGPESLKVMKLIEVLLRSAEEGKTVAIG